MKIILFLITIVVFTGCSTRNNYSSKALYQSENGIVKELLAHYQKWKGTRYELGGLSKSGVDCSGFVYIAYLKRFNLELPRTTINQIRAGYSVDKSELNPGDLVFFRTGEDSRHVGIYLDNGKFMHASSSKGVMISRLNNRYWKKHYWMCKHIPELDQL